MQGSHYWNIDAFIGQNLLGQIGDRSVRDGVMNVEEVELFILDHIHQFAGEGGIVRCIVKKRVFLGIDLVEEDIFLVMGEAHRALVGDKVNLVAFGGKG